MSVHKRGTPLEVLNRRLYQIANGEARAQLVKNLAAEARTQVMNEFRQGRDPYGNKWKPVLRGGQPLIKTGRGRNSFRGEPTYRGFRVVTSVGYMAVQNYGATIRAKSAKYLRFKYAGGWAMKKEVTIPRRQIVPEKTLGNIWTTAFVRVTNRVLEDYLEGRAHGVR